jgi:hypothetical protein
LRHIRRGASIHRPASALHRDPQYVLVHEDNGRRRCPTDVAARGYGNEPRLLESGRLSTSDGAQPGASAQVQGLETAGLEKHEEYVGAKGRQLQGGEWRELLSYGREAPGNRRQVRDDVKREGQRKMTNPYEKAAARDGCELPTKLNQWERILCKYIRGHCWGSRDGARRDFTAPSGTV